MSTIASGAMAARLNRARAEMARASRRVRLIKILCGIALGICFWYSVPYVLPFVVEQSPEKAAAAKAELSEGSLTRQIATPIIGAIALFLLWRLPRRGRLGGPMAVLCASYAGWVILSLAWSQDPSVTAKRLVVFILDALIAYALARTYSMLEMALLGLCATGSVALIALYSDVVMQRIFSLSDPDYRFQGVADANYQAMSLVVFVLTACTLLDRKPGWKCFLVPAIAFAMVLLYVTRSRLSTIVCLLLLCVIAVRLLRRGVSPTRRAVLIVAGLMVVLPALVYAVGRSGAGTAEAAFMMGRTDTENTSNLSNRAPLWSELWGYMQDRPVQGTGYAAFWTVDRVALISSHQGWAVPHAHNTYLDQALSLGMVGGGLYIAMLWTGIFTGWRRYWRSGLASDLLAACLMTWVGLESLAESVPLDPYLPTILAYACVLKMCLVEGSEAASDVWLSDRDVIGGLAPDSFRKLPPSLRTEAILLMEESHASR